jgi:hypothetical protein
LGSTDCIIDDFSKDWYKKWASVIGFPKAKHPKFWETAAIVEVLDERGYLKKGMTGIGFGVGNEQLASVFASKGVKITATDQDPSTQKAQKWNNGQLTNNKNVIYYPDIVEKETFDELVTYEPYDMNEFNDSYKGKYDFLWHNCVVGHLGSMKNSVNHLLMSSAYLKQGGSMVFTTEVNISNLNKTISDNSDTIIWRLKDIEELFTKMLKKGMVAERFHLRLGDKKDDNRINYNHNYAKEGIAVQVAATYSEKFDNPDYSEIKIPFSNYAITQVVLIFKKTKKIDKSLIKKYKEDTKENEKIINEHKTHNMDLADYYTSYSSEDYTSAELIPYKTLYNINLKPGEIKDIEINYINMSSISVFDFSFNTPKNLPPLVIGTLNPINRDSIFADTSWASPNRPSTTFIRESSSDDPSINLHRARPGEKFKFIVRLKAPMKKANYSEEFSLIFEGMGAVSSSAIGININVAKHAKKFFKSQIMPTSKHVTVEEFFELIVWIADRPDREYIVENFSKYLDNLFENEFYLRIHINGYEFIYFLKSYLESINIFGFDDDESAYYLDSYYEYKIDVRKPTHKNLPGGEALFILANPRSGNNAIAESLKKLTNYHMLSGQKILDYNLMSKPTIVINHLSRRNFLLNFENEVDHKVITIIRNPLDVLLSGFRFAQKNRVAGWTIDPVFRKSIFGINKNPSSREFKKWSRSQGARNMLKVTDSWLDDADAIIKYEDFIDNGPKAIKKLLTNLGIIDRFDNEKINASVDDIQKNLFSNGYNSHRWSTEKESWYKFIDKRTAKNIYKYHKNYFDRLNYNIDFNSALSKKEIKENIKKYW